MTYIIFIGIRALYHFCPFVVDLLHRDFVFLFVTKYVSRVFYNMNAANAFRNIYCIRLRSKKKRFNKRERCNSTVSSEDQRSSEGILVEF
mgnify:CR=1 FL=1